MPNRYRWTATDNSGGLILPSFWAANDEDAAGMLDVLLTRSLAGAQGLAASYYVVGATVQAPDPGANVTIGARLKFTTARGIGVWLLIPAALPAIFERDGETVDPAGVVAVTAAALSYLTDRAGNPVTDYIGGLKCTPPRQPLGW